MVLIGTTNDREYLRALSGENRRFLPVAVGRIDIKALIRAACPAPQTYTKAQLSEAENELDKLGAGSQIGAMLADYDVLLRQSRDCRK